jgi:hypothetical protein
LLFAPREENQGGLESGYKANINNPGALRFLAIGDAVENEIEQVFPPLWTAAFSRRTTNFGESIYRQI